MKVRKVHPWRAVWVVGSEQIAHFQQLFALLDAIGVLSFENLYHMPYGIVTDVQGKRLGKNAADATADVILDQMKSSAKKVIEERKIQIDLDDVNAVAEAVGIGAIRYAFLSRDPFKNVVYNPESALSFTGRSGPYIMYTYSRGKSVLRKALGKELVNYKFEEKINGKSSSIEISPIERELLLNLLIYPEIVLSAANNYSPSMIAEHLYTVASAFNNFYEKMTISGAKGSQRDFRFALTKLMTTVLKDGMMILGIQVLERM